MGTEIDSNDSPKIASVKISLNSNRLGKQWDMNDQQSESTVKIKFDFSYLLLSDWLRSIR